ncbi:MAG: hypothetical protein ACFFAU_12590 [Candidatus Hodarchaeota archaeon]
MVKEQPIFVESFFRILPNTNKQNNLIQQNLYFYYDDPMKNYLKLKNTGALKGELEFIQKNLQYLIDEDDIFINNKKIRMKIQQTSLKFKQEDTRFPYLLFNITSNPFQLNNNSINELHLDAQPEEITYPAISVWETFIGKFISVISPSYRFMSKDQFQVTFLLAKGVIVGGDEKLMVLVN